MGGKKPPKTRYLLKVLDAIWKNISEAVGVILVYFGRVVFLGATFSGPVCNAGITVVLACIAYVLSKEGKAKSKNSDVGDELNPNMYPDLTTSLLRHRHQWTNRDVNRWRWNWKNEWNQKNRSDQKYSFGALKVNSNAVFGPVKKHPNSVISLWKSLTKSDEKVIFDKNYLFRSRLGMDLIRHQNFFATSSDAEQQVFFIFFAWRIESTLLRPVFFDPANRAKPKMRATQLSHVKSFLRFWCRNASRKLTSKLWLINLDFKMEAEASFFFRIGEDAGF